MERKSKSKQSLLNNLNEKKKADWQEIENLKREYNNLSIKYQPILDELQDDANKLAGEFKKLFRESQEAYEFGDGASAKSLSIEGHSVKEECINLNNEANAMRDELEHLSQRIRERLNDLRDAKDQEYSLKGKTIITGFSKSRVIEDKEVREIINNLPRKLTDEIEAIDFVDRINIENSRLCAGKHKTDEKTGRSLIAVFANFYESEQKRKSEVIKTIYHEIGHIIFDKIITDTQRFQWGNWFIEGMENNSFINETAEVCRADDFCECFVEFYLDPMYLEIFDEKRYNFIKDMYLELKKINSMKKLKLVGYKRFFNLKFLSHTKIVAEVYIKDGKVVVDTKDKEAKKRLEEEINKLTYREYGVGRRGGMGLKDKTGKVIGHAQTISPCKIDDPNFLRALKDYSSFWRSEKISGYGVASILSKVVDE